MDEAVSDSVVVAIGVAVGIVTSLAVGVVLDSVFVVMGVAVVVIDSASNNIGLTIDVGEGIIFSKTLPRSRCATVPSLLGTILL